MLLTNVTLNMKKEQDHAARKYQAYNVFSPFVARSWSVACSRKCRNLIATVVWNVSGLSDLYSACTKIRCSLKIKTVNKETDGLIFLACAQDNRFSSSHISLNQRWSSNSVSESSYILQTVADTDAKVQQCIYYY